MHTTVYMLGIQDQSYGDACRSLLERVLRARLVYQRANMARAISFEYLNRQLVWHELSELLLFMLPLISVTRLKRMVMNKWPGLRAATGGHCGHCIYPCEPSSLV